MKPLILSNFDPETDEVIYSNDFGSWNVSRALRDCRDGQHTIYLLDVKQAYEACKGVEVDEVRVEAFMQRPDILAQPLLGIIEGGPIWLIDGHHRLRAMVRLGVKDFGCYVIEEKDSAPYIIWYNGKRKAPFKQY
jgi:hypothetical protein